MHRYVTHVCVATPPTAVEAGGRMSDPLQSADYVKVFLVSGPRGVRCGFVLQRLAVPDAVCEALMSGLWGAMSCALH